MKDYNYHALFYYRVLGTMQSLRGGDNVSLGDLYPKKKGEPVFYFGYEPRPDFEFQYQRDKFLVTRDKLVLIGHPKALQDRAAVLLRYDADNTQVTIYKKALEYVFGDEKEEAFTELKELLEKFYTVRVATRSDLRRVDFSKDRHGAEYNVVAV